MPTFFCQTIALTPEDLRAADVDVAVLGAFTDTGTGIRGAAHGPNAFRNAEVYGGDGATIPNMMTMVDPLKALNVVDYGNSPNDLTSTERTVHAVRALIRDDRRGAARGPAACISDDCRRGTTL